MVESISSKAGIEEPTDTSPTRWMEAAGLDPDPWQRDLLTGTWDRALLNITRQGGKSTAVAAKALDTAMSASNSLVLLLAPARRQSKEVLMKIRTMYWDAVPDVGIEKLSELRMRFANGSRIIALPGKEATIRGFSDVDLIVADEAARVPDELYEAVRPMLAVSEGQLVGMTTPKGKRGWFYNAWTDPEQEWHRVEVTGWECPRLSAEFLEQERAELGRYIFRQEYECEFADARMQMFKTSEIEAAFSNDIEPLFDSDLRRSKDSGEAPDAKRQLDPVDPEIDVLMV